jgi:hypothetical protein
MEDMRNASFQSEKMKGKDHLDNLHTGRIILSWFYRPQSMKLWTGFIWLRIRSSGRFFRIY